MKPKVYKTKADLKQILAATWYFPFLEVVGGKKGVSLFFSFLLPPFFHPPSKNSKKNMAWKIACMLLQKKLHIYTEQDLDFQGDLVEWVSFHVIHTN